MEMMTLAPVVVFAYNRPDNLKKSFAALASCDGFEKHPVVIFVDGPKGANDLTDVEAVRAFVRSLSYKNIAEIVIREKNVGLKASISSGISMVCQKYGRVIVVEDDIVLSPVALVYFDQALDKYQNNDRVWAVTGYQCAVPDLACYENALVLPYPLLWGWATWNRAWSKFDIDEAIDQRDLGSSSFAAAFDVNGFRGFRNMLDLAVRDKICTWDIQFYYKIFREAGVCISPPMSYVENIGIKKGGTHASGLNPYQLLAKKPKLSAKLCALPDVLKVDYWAIDIIRSSWDARVQKWITCLGRIKRILKIG